MTFEPGSSVLHEYTFRWSFAEHMRAQRAMTRHMRGGWQFRVLPIAIAGLLLLLVASAAILGARTRSEAWSTVLPYAIIFIVIIVVLRWGTPWMAARRIQRNDPSVKGEFHHSFSEDGVAVKTVAAAVQLTWEHIQQVVETQEFFLVYHTAQSAYFTPKRAIPTAELVTLRTMIRAHVGNRARLLSVDAAAA